MKFSSLFGGKALAIALGLAMVPASIAVPQSAPIVGAVVGAVAVLAVVGASVAVASLVGVPVLAGRPTGVGRAAAEGLGVAEHPADVGVPGQQPGRRPEEGRDLHGSGPLAQRLDVGGRAEAGRAGGGGAHPCSSVVGIGSSEYVLKRKSSA